MKNLTLYREVGRKGAWGGREAGAAGSLGRKGVWGGREAGAAPLPEGFSAGFSPLIFRTINGMEF